MIGPGIKKYAQEKGMKITKDVAYGYIGGYLVTLIDGWDIKKASISCYLTDEAINFLDTVLSDKGYEKTYKIDGYEIDNYGVSIVFTDTIGTMERVIGCVENFIGILCQNGIPCGGVCPYCQKAFEPEEETKIVLEDEFAYRVHSACGEQMAKFADFEANTRKRDKKPLITGILGAFLGCLIGTIPTIIAYYFGWYFSALSFFVGVGAKFGYDIAKGKLGAAKLVTVFSFSVVGSAFAIFFSYVATFIAHMKGLDNILTEAALSFIYSITRLTPVGISYIIDFGIAVLMAFAGAYIFLKKSHEDDKKKIFKAKILE